MKTFHPPTARFLGVSLLALAISAAPLTAQTTTPTTPPPRNQPADRMDPNRTLQPGERADTDRANQPGHTMGDRDQAEKELGRAEQRFLRKAVNLGRKEAQLARIGVDRATAPEVKRFAAQMVADHDKANNELLALVTRKGVRLKDADESAAPDNKWQEKDADDFDEDFIEQMVADHEDSVALFERAARKCKDPELLEFARKTLPTLQEHLAKAERLEATIDD